MMYSQEEALTDCLWRAYSTIRRDHGDLGMDFTAFARRVTAVFEKHAGDAHSPSSVADFFNRFHLGDLYLSEACARGGEAAWGRFFAIYQPFLLDLCAYCCGGRDCGEELAGKVLVDLYLSGKDGRSRIAAFDGRVPLASWLSVVVRRRALDEAALKSNQTEPLERLETAVDRAFVDRLHAGLRAQAYGVAIRGSLAAAAGSLSDRERLILLFKYEKGLQSNEIAATLGVSASTVSRQLQAIYKKLREAALAALAGEYRLNEAAVGECLEEILENPIYPLLAFAAA